ncbi:MAG: hypothetical protein WCI17_08730 [bacterium]
MPQTVLQSEFLVIGELPLDPGVPAAARPRIGTVFLRTPGLVTRTPLHATQRLAWIDALNEARLSSGEGPLREAEVESEWAHSVDLLFTEGHVLIRPDPAGMELAFQADELLQQRLRISKCLIRFLNVANDRVRAALRARGEYWRMNAVPLQQDEIMAHIRGSRVAIDGLPIYYYNQTTGTRFVTQQEFDGLASRPDHVLRKMLIEIKTFSARRNRQGSPEVDFFHAPPVFSRRNLEPVDFVTLDNALLRRKHAELAAAFREAVAPVLREDNPADMEWRNAMFVNLISRPHETSSKEIVQGLSPEFFLQIEWLPGARIEEGELLLDPVFAEADAEPQDSELSALCDLRAREFIFNYVREFGDIEYVNIGRIGRSMSLRREEVRRNTVYIAEVKQSGNPVPVVRIIRLQKWGIAEHLNDGVDLLTAILRAEDYTDYILDRRLGCRQLGMHLPPHVQTRRISERYMGQNSRYHGQVYWTTYFERDYVAGRASDKLPDTSYQKPEFTRRLARLLGEAACVNLLVGRMRTDRASVLFDDGDEVILLDAEGLPASLAVSDHTGTFTNYEGDLALNMDVYAAPVNRRAARMPNADEFAQGYLDAFVERFEHIQQVYRERRRAFDSLFKHRPWDPGGSMAYRWFHVLKRLDGAAPRQLAALIREHIRLPEKASQTSMASGKG